MNERPIPFLKARPAPKPGEIVKVAVLDRDGEIHHIARSLVLTMIEDYRKSGQWRAIVAPVEPRNHVSDMASNENEWIPLRTEYVPDSWVLYTRDGDKKPLYWAPPDTVWDSSKGEYVKAAVAKTAVAK